MGPILTVGEYRAAPTGVGTNMLVNQGNADEQDAELARCIDRAASWILDFCKQPIMAGSYTETQRVRVDRNGEFAFHPDTTTENLIGLSAVAYGPRVNALTAVSDLSGVWVDRGNFRVPIGSAVMSLPTIQFGRLIPGDPWIVRYTFTAGWSCTTLAVAAAAAANTITVADPVGIVAGGPYTIWDGKLTEKVTVLSVLGSVVTLTAGLVNAHPIGAGFYNMPESLKGAAINVTSATITAPRGSDALTTTNTQTPGAQIGADPVGAMNLRQAREVLYNHQRVR